MCTALICQNHPVMEKAYGFVLREAAEGHELLVFEHAGVPEAGLQVPGGTVKEGVTPVQAVSREVLEESGLLLGGWQAVSSFETGGQRWHCYATAPGFPLPDSWRCEPLGPERTKGLRFEFRWVALAGGEELAGTQEAARRAVAAFVDSGR